MQGRRGEGRGGEVGGGEGKDDGSADADNNSSLPKKASVGILMGIHNVVTNILKHEYCL